jgi:predicted ATPase/class 3 adenylate cyclase/Tfp pilus assembly protein PilF
MPQFPAGTVTFLFTDIEQSTQGWERDATAARVVVERHLALIRQNVESHGGVHFKTIGDGTQSAFATAPQGVAAALEAQRALLGEPWPSAEQRPRVRMALHAGTAEPRDGDYLAACLNRLARLLDAAHGEQILLSSTVAGLAREALPESVTLEALGEYRLRDILQPEEIFQLCHPELRQDFPPLNTPGHLPHNLPTHPTPFLGREQEVEEITALLLRPEVCLVTLTGPGGVGKTRLGMRVAAEALESFPDGAFLVDLARLTDPDLVASATATALGLREQPGQSLRQTLAEYLRELSILILFDNFEHVLSAAPLVADLLTSAPGLKVLATSRARLGLQAEHEYRIEPLPIPDQESLPPLAELSTFDAIKLFTSRAQALRPGFTLTEENAPVVAEIVCQLDGLPLAIELAAARVKLLSPAALRDRLSRRLSTLTGGARDLPARQRTLRDTIAWSHDLLAPPEKILFRRLSVFVGGWTIEAAEAVAAVDASETVDAFQALASLVDQSLVDEWPTPDALAEEPRYGMLETIREFASEHLAASGEIIQIERVFENFLIARAEAAEEGLQGPDQRLWFDRLEVEHDNIRAALGRALNRNDGAVALSLALRLREFWWTRGYWREGRDWLGRTVALAGSVDVAGRAAAEFGLGRLSLALGDYDAAEAHFRQSLDARRRLGDAVAEAEVLSALAMIALNRLAYDEARGLGEDALKSARDSGDRRGTATALRNLGMIAREQGEYERALGLLEEAMAVGRALGDAAWTARVASQMGITHRLAGHAEQARHYLETSRKLHTDLGDRFALAVIASNSGHLVFDAGDVKRAVTLYAEALRHFDSVGEPEGFVEAIEWLAVAAVARGQAVPALRLFGAAAAAREALQLPPHNESDEKRFASGLDQAMRAAGTGAPEALAAGRTLSLERARDEALEFARVEAGSTNVVP